MNGIQVKLSKNAFKNFGVGGCVDRGEELKLFASNHVTHFGHHFLPKCGMGGIKNLIILLQFTIYEIIRFDKIYKLYISSAELRE